MKNKETHIKQIASHIKLSDAQKKHMRHMVFEYVSMKPVADTAHTKKPVSYTLFSFIAHKRAFTALVVTTLVLTSGSGVAFASQDALPGDKLYPIKIATEEVRETLAIRQETKARIVLERAERRLAESVVLAKRTQYSNDTDSIQNTARITDLQNKSQQHLIRAERVLQRIEKRNPKKVQIIRNKIEAHKKRIKTIKNEPKHIVPTLKKEILTPAPKKVEQRTINKLENKIHPIKTKIKRTLAPVKETPRQSQKPRIQIKKKVQQQKTKADDKTRQIQKVLQHKDASKSPRDRIKRVLKKQKTKRNADK
jgi:hypothetical protein